MPATVVKICGLTNLADARVAVAAGADLLGFIFYAKSPRYVAPETVATIAQTLRQEQTRASQAAQPGEMVAPLPKLVGVFVNTTVEAIQGYIDQIGLDYIQLHGNESAAWFPPLAPRAYKALRPADAAAAMQQAAHFAPLGSPTGPCLMIDAYDPQAYGGTGKQADWHVVTALARLHPRLLLAGGLTPANVATAIEQVRPWGVDVGSGVEAEPGRKDHDKVKEFVNRAKTPSR
ncbi:MAG: phosphoribosylanthranilate isomerase [Caldilineaceae bacterium]|nr:phosphoribosylanthranilate isomerase [Caldilineaceae bacterium]